MIFGKAFLYKNYNYFITRLFYSPFNYDLAISKMNSKEET